MQIREEKILTSGDVQRAKMLKERNRRRKMKIVPVLVQQEASPIKQSRDLAYIDTITGERVSGSDRSQVLDPEPAISTSDPNPQIAKREAKFEEMQARVDKKRSIAPGENVKKVVGHGRKKTVKKEKK